MPRPYKGPRIHVKSNYAGGGSYKDIDEGIKKEVAWFNEAGHATHASCEGDVKEGRVDAYVSFKSEKTREIWWRVANGVAQPCLPFKSYFSRGADGKKVKLWQYRPAEKQKLDAKKECRFIKRFGGCFILFMFPPSMFSPSKADVHVISYAGADTGEGGGKVNYFFDFPDIKRTGKAITQKEWDAVRYRAFKYLIAQFIKYRNRHPVSV